LARLIHLQKFLGHHRKYDVAKRSSKKTAVRFTVDGCKNTKQVICIFLGRRDNPYAYAPTVFRTANLYIYTLNVQIEKLSTKLSWVDAYAWTHC
jgi:hypothetical protein